MTSFTHTDSYGDSLVVESDVHGAAVSSESGNTVYVPKEDAPAVALAILEAAGWEPRRLGEGPLGDEKVHVATSYLAEHLREDALATEALALLNAATDSCFANFPNETIRETWLRAARRARELHS